MSTAKTIYSITRAELIEKVKAKEVALNWGDDDDGKWVLKFPSLNLDIWLDKRLNHLDEIDRFSWVIVSQEKSNSARPLEFSRHRHPWDNDELKDFATAALEAEEAFLKKLWRGIGNIEYYNARY